MIEFEIAFRGEQDGSFRVITQPTPNYRREPVETAFADENEFLERIIAADLTEDTTTTLVVAVLLALAEPPQAQGWLPVYCSQQQILSLGLGHALQPSTPEPPFLRTQCFMDCAAQFYDFLMNAPTPFVMLTGPDLVFSFINLAYVQLLGRDSGEQLLGRPVREALPEPGFQECLSVLQKAYDTGFPQVRRNMLNTFRQEDTGLVVEAYFDIVYHPVRDASGMVTGIMAQATDVTERVLVRQVNESREQKLFALCAELQNVYSIAPDLQPRTSVLERVSAGERSRSLLIAN